MNHHEVSRYNMFITVRQFGNGNASDFPAGSVGAAQFAEIDTVINLLVGYAADQTDGAGTARMGYLNKDTARENLRETLYEITRTARSMEYEFPGISAKFRMPRSASDQNMISTAWSFSESAVQYQEDFVAYGLPADFLEDLTHDAQAFQDSVNMPAAGMSEQVAATAQIGAIIRRGMIAVRILNGVVKNKYRNNPGKLAAWATASHTERAPRSLNKPENG